MKFLEGAQVWTKGKQGELPGYRSSVTVVEDMKVGIFTSCLVSDASEHSVWTVPALAVLVPAVEAALWRLQPAPTLPPSAEEYVGTYGPKDARV